MNRPALAPFHIGVVRPLRARALTLRIKEVSVSVAALQDIIRSKEAANRPKDQRTLPTLRQLLKEIEARGRGPV